MIIKLLMAFLVTVILSIQLAIFIVLMTSLYFTKRHNFRTSPCSYLSRKILTSFETRFLPLLKVVFPTLHR